MRTVYWVLAIAAVLAILLSNRSAQFAPFAQFDERPAFWPAVQAVGLYRPRSRMGDNSLTDSADRDAKLACTRTANNWVIQ
jgi:hypothetical protein